MKVYLASSWRNQNYEQVRFRLIDEGFDVYDFKDPDNEFHWREIDHFWNEWTSADVIHNLNNKLCNTAFEHDYSALLKCDVLVLLNPCGKSAHLEAGVAIGMKKPVIIYQYNGEPELMYKMSKYVTNHIDGVLKILHQVKL